MTVARAFKVWQAPLTGQIFAGNASSRDGHLWRMSGIRHDVTADVHLVIARMSLAEIARVRAVYGALADDLDSADAECPTCGGDCFVDAITEAEIIWPDARGPHGEPLANCPDCTPKGESNE